MRVWIKNFWRKIISDEDRVALAVGLVFLAFFAAYIMQPKIEGDSLLYVNSIKVLQTGQAPSGFIPMMILSTYLGLRLIMFLNIFLGQIEISWLFLNAVLYVVMGLFFYALLKRFFLNRSTVWLGTALLALNYGALSFGMAYMMDVGGWVAYIAALYFSYRYLIGPDQHSMYLAALSIGLGGIYKEYAFVAYIVLFGVICFKDWGNWRILFKRLIQTDLISFGPFILTNLYTYLYFDGYTYWDWFLHNQHSYTYQNRLVEFIKSFGSIYNFGWFLFLPGAYILLKKSRDIFQDRQVLFIWLTILSGSAVLLWPVVTRVLFVTMPAAILVSSLFIEKLGKKSWWILPLIIVYALTNFFMDIYILDVFNLPF